MKQIQVLGRRNEKPSDIITDQNHVVGLSAKINKENKTNPQTHTSSNYITVDNGIGILSGDLAVDALDWIKKTYAPYSVRINNISTVMDDNNIPVIAQSNPDFMIMVNMYLKKNHPQLRVATQQDLFEANKNGIFSNLDSLYNIETGIILNTGISYEINHIVENLKKEITNKNYDSNYPLFINYASIEIEVLEIKINNRTQKHVTYKIKDNPIFPLISTAQMREIWYRKEFYNGDNGMPLVNPSKGFIHYETAFQRLINTAEDNKYYATTRIDKEFIDSRIWIVNPDKFYEDVIAI